MDLFNRPRKGVSTRRTGACLTLTIHEFKLFVNSQGCEKAVCFLASFDAVLCTLLKVSPERRPEKAAVEARRADCS